MRYGTYALAHLPVSLSLKSVSVALGPAYLRENSRSVIQRRFIAEVVVLESDPDETTGLWQDPQRECNPCLGPLGPPLAVQKFAEYDNRRNGDGGCTSQHVVSGSQDPYLRRRKDERARARTEKCSER